MRDEEEEGGGGRGTCVTEGVSDSHRNGKWLHSGCVIKQAVAMATSKQYAFSEGTTGASRGVG